eukprot:gene3756-6644_t
MHEKVVESFEEESKVNLLIRNVIGVGVSFSVLAIIIAIGVVEYLTITNLPLQPPYIFIGKTNLDKFNLPTYCPSANNTKCCEAGKPCSLQFEDPTNITIDATVILAMQNINPNEPFFWKDMISKLALESNFADELMRGFSGNGTMGGLDSSEIPLKLKFNQDFDSLRKLLCALDQKENPEMYLDIKLVDFMFANQTYQKNLTAAMKFDFLSICENSKEKCEIDPLYRADICGSTRVYSIEQLLRSG